MGRLVLLAFGGLLVVVAVMFVVTYVQKMRLAAAEQGCKNHLKGLAVFAAFQATEPGRPPVRLAEQIPAGTVVLPGVPADDRLSWAAVVLPGLDQRRGDVKGAFQTLDPTKPWAAGRNQQAARARLSAFLCPADPPADEPDRPAPTNYVGVAGLGADAATIALPPVGPAPPRAGCFRYDGPTPFDAITDGLSQSLLFGERSGDLGPWLRGGPATLRGLDDAAGARPLLGPGGQFGGNHPAANWALADGGVRAFTGRVDPAVLFGLATITGKETDIRPGD